MISYVLINKTYIELKIAITDSFWVAKFASVETQNSKVGFNPKISQNAISNFIILKVCIILDKFTTEGQL